MIDKVVAVVAFALLIVGIVLALARNEFLNATFVVVLSAAFLYVVSAFLTVVR